ncbi:MAG: protein kinase [Gemmatimonadales bacterium]
MRSIEMELEPDSVLDTLRKAVADRYHVDRAIGTGGAAVVFRAMDLRHARQVAIKVLQPELTHRMGARRFLQEIRIAARLAHPHVLPLLDSGSFTVDRGLECPYYVMPLVQGDTLRQRLVKGALPVEEALRIFGEVADAVQYAHRRGIVHRDIKPENVMFLEDHAVIADFGIARALDQAGEGDRITRTGVLIGTPAYMSPEQITGEGRIDHRTDIYALACMLFEMLSGKVPFAGATMRESLSRRLSEPPPPLSRSGAHVSPAIEAAVLRAMATEPEDRFDSVADFLAALGGSAPSQPRATRRWRPWLVLGAPVLALVVLALVWTLGRPPAGGTIGSVAIRPLVNASGDSTASYLSEGIEEAVADLLRGVPGLGVTAPTLVGQILAEQPAIDLQALGRRVGAQSVLTWTVRRQTDSIHLRAELVATEDGRMLWGQTFNRPESEVVGLPEEIVRTVAEMLGLELERSHASRLARVPTRDAAAYDAYLRGRRVWVKSTPLGASDSRSNADSILYYAERALQRDPNFAGAHFLRAAFYTVAAMRGWRQPFGAAMDTAIAAGAKTLALDSTFSDAHMVLAIIDLYATDRWEDAGRRLRTALALNPDLPTTHQYYGIYLGEIERRLDSAIVHLRRAVSLDPQSHFLNTLGDLLLRARKLDSAAQVLRQAVALDPQVTGQRRRLVRVLEDLGRYDEAVSVRRAGADSVTAPAFADALARDGAAGYVRQLRAELRHQIDSLATVPATVIDTAPPIRPHRIAKLFARLEEWPLAMDWVIREYERRPRRLIYVLGDPDFDGLRQEPRFLALVREAGLESWLTPRSAR